MDQLRERPMPSNSRFTLMQHTHTPSRRLRWWRGLACGLAVNRLFGWGLPLGLAREGTPSRKKSRKGSHNVVVGQQHNYSRFGGIVVGECNTISDDFAVLSGGRFNTASGRASSVSGGEGSRTPGSKWTIFSGSEGMTLLLQGT